MHECNSASISPSRSMKRGGIYLFILIVKDYSIKNTGFFSRQTIIYFPGYAKCGYLGLKSDKCFKNCSFQVHVYLVDKTDCCYQCGLGS